MFIFGYFIGVSSSIVAASIIIVLARAYDRIKEKKDNAVNNTSTD